MGHVRVFVRDVGDFVFAVVRVEDALRAQHPQPHIQVAWVGPKQRRQLIHIAPGLEDFLQHPTHVQDGNHAAQGEAVQVKEQPRAPLALQVFGRGNK